MAMELSRSRWVEETQHGRTIFRIDSDGIHVTVITDLENGHTKVSDEVTLPFSKVEDLAVGQSQLI